MAEQRGLGLSLAVTVDYEDAANGIVAARGCGVGCRTVLSDSQCYCVNENSNSLLCFFSLYANLLKDEVPKIVDPNPQF
ncbi:hypothetical protein VNO77_36289 [Canavalia gladiata]|uniref:Uncharacterized protein n=1 Tax=Canavalia gladiata TaxID=3824 RepID=A0AAN9K910_CANGL